MTAKDIYGNSRFSKMVKAEHAGGRKEDEGRNFNRIVNSWYLTPQGTKFSQKEGDRREEDKAM